MHTITIHHRGGVGEGDGKVLVLARVGLKVVPNR